MEYGACCSRDVLCVYIWKGSLSPLCIYMERLIKSFAFNFDIRDQENEGFLCSLIVQK